jgi:hypothetical protein
METNEERPGILGSSLALQIPDQRVEETPLYTVKHGIRTDDYAVVFQFFPPQGGWNPAFKMDKRLELCIPKNFGNFPIHTSFATELDSFCVIVGRLGRAIEPTPLIDLFLSEISTCLPEDKS